MAVDTSTVPRDDTGVVMPEPLASLLRDPAITHVLVKALRDVWVRRGGDYERAAGPCPDARQLSACVESLIALAGSHYEGSPPVTQVRLADGSSVTCILPPFVEEGPLVMIERRTGGPNLTAEDLLQRGSATENMLTFLRAAVEARAAIVISGTAGSGKTSLLEILAGFIPQQEFVSTVEQTRRLAMERDRVARFELGYCEFSRLRNTEAASILPRVLAVSPDRVLIDDSPAEELLDLLWATRSSGQDGWILTVHARSPRDCLARIESLAEGTTRTLRPNAVRHLIASSVNLIVQTAKFRDGSRRITHITEMTGMEGGFLTLQDLFVFERTGIGPAGEILGRFRPTGIRPRLVEKIRECGIRLTTSIFLEAAAVP
jgi:pilus assembly protein CpaF